MSSVKNESLSLPTVVAETSNNVNQEDDSDDDSSSTSSTDTNTNTLVQLNKIETLKESLAGSLVEQANTSVTETTKQVSTVLTVKPDVVDYNSDEMHDEVETLLFGLAKDKRTTYELIAADPKFYLDIIQNYKVTRDGKEIYLPNLLNILPSRNKNGLKLKFRFNDNDRWIAVGYDGINIPEAEVLKSFSEKILLHLKHPTKGNDREHLEAELNPDGEGTRKERNVEDHPLINQGDQMAISKLDRFMNAGKPAVVPESSLQSNSSKTESSLQSNSSKTESSLQSNSSKTTTTATANTSIELLAKGSNFDNLPPQRPSTNNNLSVKTTVNKETKPSINSKQETVPNNTTEGLQNQITELNNKFRNEFNNILLLKSECPLEDLYKYQLFINRSRFRFLVSNLLTNCENNEIYQKIFDEIFNN